MIYKVGVCGVTGKLGMELSNFLASDFHHEGSSLEMVDAIASSKKLMSIDGVSIRTLGEPLREPAHIWIDFSHPQATLKLLEEIETPIVIGTTGFSDTEISKIESYAKKYPVLLSPNMAPGMNALLGILEKSNFHTLGFTTVVSEAHHIHKKDSPSGTLKRLVKVLENGGTKDIQIQVTRAGEVLGIHTLKFISDSEEITLEHRVSDRKVFAKGALMAAVALLKKKIPKIYSYSEVMDL